MERDLLFQYHLMVKKNNLIYDLTTLIEVYLKILVVKSVVKDEVIIYGLRDKTWTIYFFMMKAKKVVVKSFLNSLWCTRSFTLSI